MNYEIKLFPIKEIPQSTNSNLPHYEINARGVADSEDLYVKGGASGRGILLEVNFIRVWTIC